MPSWPWTFATQPAGNVLASKLDDNFNAAVFAAGSSTNNAIPQWNGTTGNALQSGGLALGTAVNNIPQIQSNGLLPPGIGTIAAAVQADGAGTVQFAYNIASVVRSSAGVYVVSFTNVAPSPSYVTVVTPEYNGPALFFGNVITKTANNVTVGTVNALTSAFQDATFSVLCAW